MGKRSVIITDEIFIDIDDLIYLIREHTPLNSKEDIFNRIFYWIYEEKGLTPSTRDALDSRSKKRLPFHEDLRIHAPKCDINKAYSFISKQIGKQIRNGSVFAQKLLYLIQKDNISFFDTSDLKLDKVGDCIYLLAYISQKMIMNSDAWTKYKHSDDYNPFRDFVQTDTPSMPINVSSTDTTLLEFSKALCAYYQAERNHVISFDDELLSQAIPYVIDDSFNYFTNDLSVNLLDDTSKEQALRTITADNEENTLIVGEGGIGKTTFLLSHFKTLLTEKDNVIPLYIKLSDCSSITDYNKIIINSLLEQMNQYVTKSKLPSYFDIINSFKNSSYKYVLLLDGFNEITTLDFGKIRDAIATEINNLTKIKNIQIIVTSRDVEFYILALNKFQVYRATGITTDTIYSYLQEKFSPELCVKIANTDHLMTLLHTPLFLLMFTHTVSPDTSLNKLPENRGSILYQYFNCNSALYTEMNKDTNLNNMDTNIIRKFMLDFVIPDIGHYMESNELFSISEDEFEDILKKCIIDFKKKHEYFSTKIYEHYDNAYNSTDIAVALISKCEKTVLILSICDNMNIMARDNMKNLYFCHQFVRDYFSAYYFIRESAILNKVSRSNPQLLDSFDTSWGNKLWNNEKIALVKEIIVYNNGIYNIDNLIQTLSLFKYNKRCHLPRRNYEITNILKTLTLLYDADLSFLDLSYLDLSVTNITGINFHNTTLNRNANFEGTIIGRDTYMGEKHFNDVLRWDVSEDERFIISISSYEFKVWDIATHTCIYTRYLPFFEDEVSQSSSMVDCKLYKNGTFTLFLLFDRVTSSHRAFSYDFTIDQFTEYIPSEGNNNILMFSYVPDEDHIVAMTYTHYIVFTCNVKKPTESLPHDADFVSFIVENCHTSTELDRVYYSYRLFYLDKENILICITNNNVPESTEYITEMLDYYTSHPFFEFEKGMSNEHRIKEPNISYLNNQAVPAYINYFLYNITAKSLNMLHLDSAAVSGFTLKMKKDSTLDVTAFYTAVSNDGRFIVVRDKYDIYRYDMWTADDYLFTKVCPLPYGFQTFEIEFCHYNNNYLYIYDSSHALKLDILTGQLLFCREFTYNTGCSTVKMTDNYWINQITVLYSTSYSITNIYSNLTTIFYLSRNNHIVDLSIDADNKYFYALYNNGTLLTYSLPNHDLIDIYNYLYQKTIISSTCDKDDTQYCLCHIEQDNILDNRQSIIKFNMKKQGKPIESGCYFYKIQFIYLYPETNYLLLFTEFQIHLLDKDSLQLLSSCELEKNNRYYTPKEVFYSYETNKAYAVYAPSHADACDSFGNILTIDIYNNEIILGSPIYIPRFDLEQTTSPLLVKRIGFDNLCLIKAIEKHDVEFVQYKYRIYSNEYDTTEPKPGSYERCLSDWCIVSMAENLEDCIPIDGYFFYTLREFDFLIHSNYRQASLLVEQNNVFYEWNRISNLLTPIDFIDLSKLNHICYDANNHLISGTIEDNREIQTISITNKCLVNSYVPNPELFVYKCDFTNCKFSNDVSSNTLIESGAILYSK